MRNATAPGKPIHVTDDLYARVMARAEPGPGGCLLNTAPPTTDGYGQTWTPQNGPVVTHRLVWTYHHGPIPAGMTVDHICHVRACLKVAHLRLLTPEANGADNRQKKTAPEVDRFCPRHPDERMVRDQGKSRRVYCHACHAAYSRAFRARRRARKAAGV
jgi:hypothetical protein